MRYNSLINNVKAKEWGLNISQAYLFAWFYELPSWAEKEIIDNEVFYFASKHKILDELPLLTDKVDTVYRYYKQLEEVGLIKIVKIDNKDYVSLTKKAMEWNLGNKPNNSEINPTLGNKSDNNSDLNPTDNIISIYTITKDKINNKKSKSSKTKKDEPFIKPNVNEVKQYFLERGYKPSVGEKFYNYYEVLNWHNRDDREVKNWKLTAVNNWFTEQNKLPKISEFPYLHANGIDYYIQGRIEGRPPEEGFSSGRFEIKEQARADFERKKKEFYENC